MTSQTPSENSASPESEKESSPFADTHNSLHNQNLFTYGLLAILLAIAVWAGWQGNWMAVLACLVTFGLILLPMFIANLNGFRVPRTMYTFIVLFLIATLVLGEVFDFYNQFWWWDVVLHTGSAIGFGLIGVVTVLLMFKGVKLDNPPPFLVALLGFCFAVAIGTLWEVFEFGMDQLFGLNMQKSGLIDTMYDLIVDCIGAFIGASGGWAYLRGSRGPLSALLARFLRYNHRWAKSRAAEGAASQD